MNKETDRNPFADWLDQNEDLILQEPPPWRDFRLSFAEGESIDWGSYPDSPQVLAKQKARALRHAFRRKMWEIEVIRAALVLRRPILITGKPGVGKSSLAYVAAHFLNLGPVLRWDVGSRSTVQDGVYQYDAIARLQAATIREKDSQKGASNKEDDIGAFIRLGPLGTAILPWKKPRVLLIDEIDKSDLDLPDDLLHLLEDGECQIPELTRLGAKEKVNVFTADSDAERAVVTGGKLQCYEFPLVFMTSNGERDFSSAFLRRCLHLKLERPEVDELEDIVEKQLNGRSVDMKLLRKMAEEMHARLKTEEVTTDQLLNTFFAAAYHNFEYTGDKQQPGIEQSSMINVDDSPVPPEDEYRRSHVD